MKLPKWFSPKRLFGHKQEALPRRVARIWQPYDTSFSNLYHHRHASPPNVGEMGGIRVNRLSPQLKQELDKALGMETNQNAFLVGWRRDARHFEIIFGGMSDAISIGRFKRSVVIKWEKVAGNTQLLTNTLRKR